MAIAVAFSLMGTFFLLGLYVAGALGLLAIVMMWLFSDAPLINILGVKAWETLTQIFPLVAVPMFILMGELMLRSGMGQRMYDVLSRWLSFLPGGLIHTNIASCAVFAACSGSTVATAATISRVSLPSFRQRNYNERLVVGSLAAGGTLGILIPPSISLIIYGVLVEESIGRLYLAGLFPGFMLALVFMIMIAVVAKIWPGIAPPEQLVSWRARLFGLVNLSPVLLLIFVVLGSIYLGWATPTEAAAFGVSGALVLTVLGNSLFLQGVFIRLLLLLPWPANLRSSLVSIAGERPLHLDSAKRDIRLNFRIIQESTISATRTSAMIMLIIVASFTLSFAFARLGISHDISEFITGLELSPKQLIFVLVIFYLLLGTFMESFAMMVTTVPILAPALIAMDVDLVWFGIIMVILVEAALISPPEGINLYILHGVRREVQAEIPDAEGHKEQVGTIADVYIGVLPFMACMAIVVALIILFPDIALWLPNAIKGSPG
jgi:TRAP-type C4-dicarboxylate transport system permease large subunit